MGNHSSEGGSNGCAAIADFKAKGTDMNCIPLLGFVTYGTFQDGSSFCCSRSIDLVGPHFPKFATTVFLSAPFSISL